jgi:hypothetical protein
MAYLMSGGLAAQPIPGRPRGRTCLRLAERPGSVNTAAAELGATWPSLRKAFARHGLGMPDRNRGAGRQRAIQAVRCPLGTAVVPCSPLLHAHTCPKGASGFMRGRSRENRTRGPAGAPSAPRTLVLAVPGPLDRLDRPAASARHRGLVGALREHSPPWPTAQAHTGKHPIAEVRGPLPEHLKGPYQPGRAQQGCSKPGRIWAVGSRPSTSGPITRSRGGRPEAPPPLSMRRRARARRLQPVRIRLDMVRGESVVPFGGGSYEIRLAGRLSDSVLAAFECEARG